jgi:hypothetical protein
VCRDGTSSSKQICNTVINREGENKKIKNASAARNIPSTLQINATGLGMRGGRRARFINKVKAALREKKINDGGRKHVGDLYIYIHAAG